ncbi:MAG: hypothetical protein LBP35_06585 [Candidatus Ancillula trichonymphae]|nr:hypothetical protein [Candidatus Ancillula trichonymphae]
MVYIDQQPKTADVFLGFHAKRWKNAEGGILYLLRQLFVTFHLLLFIIPGFVKLFACALSLFLLGDGTAEQPM